MRNLVGTVFAVLSIFVFTATTSPVLSTKNTIVWVEGPIVAVTPEDITIKSAERARDWFRLPGSAARIRAGDQLTPYPREALHPGLRVRIYYDWRLLTTVRVADHIVVLLSPDFAAHRRDELR
jgi:hypothetical protein